MDPIWGVIANTLSGGLDAYSKVKLNEYENEQRAAAAKRKQQEEFDYWKKQEDYRNELKGRKDAAGAERLNEGNTYIGQAVNNILTGMPGTPAREVPNYLNLPNASSYMRLSGDPVNPLAGERIPGSMNERLYNFLVQPEMNKTVYDQRPATDYDNELNGAVNAPGQYGAEPSMVTEGGQTRVPNPFYSPYNDNPAPSTITLPAKPGRAFTNDEMIRMMLDRRYAQGGDVQRKVMSDLVKDRMGTAEDANKQNTLTQLLTKANDIATDKNLTYEEAGNQLRTMGLGVEYLNYFTKTLDKTHVGWSEPVNMNGAKVRKKMIDGKPTGEVDYLYKLGGGLGDGGKGGEKTEDGDVDLNNGAIQEIQKLENKLFRLNQKLFSGGRTGPQNQEELDDFLDLQDKTINTAYGELTPQEQKTLDEAFGADGGKPDGVFELIKEAHKKGYFSTRGARIALVIARARYRKWNN